MGYFIHKIHNRLSGQLYIHRLILAFYIRFPQFLNEKRYKLIKFASDCGNVDKLL